MQLRINNQFSIIVIPLSQVSMLPLDKQSGAAKASSHKITLILEKEKETEFACAIAFCKNIFAMVLDVS